MTGACPVSPGHGDLASRYYGFPRNELAYHNPASHYTRQHPSPGSWGHLSDPEAAGSGHQAAWSAQYILGVLQPVPRDSPTPYRTSCLKKGFLLNMMEIPTFSEAMCHQELKRV